MSCDILTSIAARKSAIGHWIGRQINSFMYFTCWVQGAQFYGGWY